MVKALIAALIAATLVNGPLAAQEYLEGYIMLSLHNELPNPVRRMSSGRFASGLSSLDNILARHRTEVFTRFSGFTAYGRRLYKLQVPSTVNIESVLQDLRNNPNVEHAERITQDEVALFKIPKPSPINYCCYNEKQSSGKQML